MNNTGDINVVIIDDYDKFMGLKEAWNRLVKSATGMNIFQTFDWNHCWWQAYGEDHKLLILNIERAGKTIGIVPLMISNGIIEFIGTPNADYSDFITTEPDICIGAAVDYLRCHKKLWSFINLSQIPEKSNNLPILERELKNAGMPYRLNPIENVMAYCYDGDESARAGFEVHKGGTIKKFMNFFNKMDGLSLVSFDSSDEILKRLNEFYHSHIVWWFRRGGDGCKFLNPKVRQFHDLAAKGMGEGGRVRFYVLSHGRQPLAYLYAFIYGPTIYLYQIASLMNYRKKSPGILLLSMLVEAAIREGFGVVDFSRGAGEHKERFANRSGRNMQCAVYESGIKKSLAAIYSGLKDSSAGRKLKKFGPARKLKNRIMGRAPGDYSPKAKKTANVLFAGEAKRPEFEYYYRAAGIIEQKAVEEPIKFEELTKKDLALIAAFIGIENDTEDYARLGRRFDSGGRCFLARYNGHPAALGWLLEGSEDLPDEPAVIMKSRNAVFNCDVGISPVFDSIHFQESFYHFLCAECNKSGRDFLVACVFGDKKLAAVLAKMGFNRLGS